MGVESIAGPSVRRMGLVSSAAMLLSASGVAGQLQLVPRLGFGGGTATTALAGLRTRRIWDRWGVFAGIEAREYLGGCAASQPPICILPGDATQVSAGIVRVSPSGSGLPTYGSVGVGILRWEGTNLFVEAGAGMSAPLSASLSFEFGVRGMVVPWLERQTPAVVVRRKTALLAEVVIGMSIDIGPN